MVLDFLDLRCLRNIQVGLSSRWLGTEGRRGAEEGPGLEVEMWACSVPTELEGSRLRTLGHTN